MRPIWKGTISFGLVNIPVNLFSAEEKTEASHFHLLDKKNHARIHYQRINELTGKKVAWEEVEKAYEFKKGKYTVIDEKMLEKTAATDFENIEIMDFVPKEEIDPIFYEKPYYLTPESGAKGYYLLHKILTQENKIGIAKVVIKTREHLGAIIPFKDFFSLVTLRYEKNIRELKKLGIKNKSTPKITPKELALAEKLIKNMSKKWNPKKYHDTNREMLEKLIYKKIHQGKAVTPGGRKAKKTVEKVGKSEKVVDFMALLKKSIATKKRNPAKKLHAPPTPTKGRPKKHA